MEHYAIHLYQLNN